MRPFFLNTTFSDTVLPGLISGVTLPPILKLCPIFPLFVTSKMTVPTGTDDFESVNLNSLAVTRTVTTFDGAPKAGTTSAAATPIPASASVAPAIQTCFKSRIPPERKLSWVTSTDGAGRRSGSQVPLRRLCPIGRLGQCVSDDQV